MGSRLWTWLARTTAAGYERRAEPDFLSAVFVVCGEGGIKTCNNKEDALRSLRLSVGGIAIILPTIVGRASEHEHSKMLSDILAQLTDVRERHPLLQLVLIVGMQWSGGERKQSLERLGALSYLANESHIPFLGLSLPKRGKVATLNIAIDVAAAFGAEGVFWMDDDVSLERFCMARLVDRFIEKGCRGAVGATKKGYPRQNLSSRVLFLLKSLTQPACNYPHGCCILVDLRVLRTGIPERYVSDDGFVCFQLLAPDRPDPLELLELVPDAECLHFVGGTAGQNRSRIRRMLTNHVVFMADYPEEVSKYYFRHMLFYGLWPLAPWDNKHSIPFATAKWILKAFYFGWFVKVATVLFVRGFIHKPQPNIVWGGAPNSEAPGRRNT